MGAKSRATLDRIQAASAAAAAGANGSALDEIEVWKCIHERPCLGGVLAVDESCAPGNEGPLCGICSKGYYRSRLQCEPCAMGAESRDASVTNAIVILVIASVLVIVLTSLYLVRARNVDTTAERVETRVESMPISRRRIVELRKLRTLLSARLVTGSSLARIALGFCQSASVFQRFLNVHWPNIFIEFLRSLDHLNLDILGFEFVPAECALGRPLGFHVELMATLLTPLLLLACLLLLAMLLAPCIGRSCGPRSLRDWPQIWDVAVWMLLIQFPTISRKTLSAFDCVPFELTSLLRADPSRSCTAGYYVTWAGVAGGGALVFCIGLPLGAFCVIRQFVHAPTSSERRLVQVLTRSYREECWYMEPLDLLRKFLVTGVIMLVLPQSRVQLWFGTVVTLLFFVIHLHLEPFRDRTCNSVQLAVHLQLLLTYVTALLFHDEDGDTNRYVGGEVSGLILVGGNSISFFLIFLASLGGVRKVLREMRQRWLTFHDGTPIELSPPQHPEGYHLFISHVWKHAQDQAGTIKSTLRALVPSAKVFLDVDDLEDVSRLEEYVRATDIILIVVTQDYLSSRNCRRELITAFLAKKPLILLLETDPDHGAVTAQQLRTEAETVARTGQPMQHVRAASRLATMVENWQKGAPLLALVGGKVCDYDIIQWHREKDLKEAVFKLVATKMLQHQPNGHRFRTLDPLSLGISAAADDPVDAKGSKGSMPEGTRRRQGLGNSAEGMVRTRRAVYLSSAYKQVSLDGNDSINAFAAISQLLRRPEFNVDVTDDPTADQLDGVRLPVLVILCPSVFGSNALIRHIDSLLGKERNAARKSRGHAHAHDNVRASRMTRMTIRHNAGGGGLAGALASITGGGGHGSRASRAREDAGLPKIVPLYSTVLPFSCYMANCAELAPRLTERGLFSHLFQKLPPSELLQRAVACHVADMLPLSPFEQPLEPPKEHAIEATEEALDAFFEAARMVEEPAAARLPANSAAAGPTRPGARPSNACLNDHQALLDDNVSFFAGRESTFGGAGRESNEWGGGGRGSIAQMDAFLSSIDAVEEGHETSDVEAEDEAAEEDFGSLSQPTRRIRAARMLQGPAAARLPAPKARVGAGGGCGDACGGSASASADMGPFVAPQPLPDNFTSAAAHDRRSHKMAEEAPLHGADDFKELPPSMRLHRGVPTPRDPSRKQSVLLPRAQRGSLQPRARAGLVLRPSNAAGKAPIAPSGDKAAVAAQDSHRVLAIHEEEEEPWERGSVYSPLRWVRRLSLKRRSSTDAAAATSSEAAASAQDSHRVLAIHDEEAEPWERGSVYSPISSWVKRMSRRRSAGSNQGGCRGRTGSSQGGPSAMEPAAPGNGGDGSAQQYSDTLSTGADDAPGVDTLGAGGPRVHALNHLSA